MENAKNDQVMIEKTEKKFLGLTKKAWKKVGVIVASALAIGGTVYAVKKAKARKTAANEVVEVEQPQVEEQTPRENKNNEHRFGGNRNGRWNNNQQ
jgi:hypothetical protein